MNLDIYTDGGCSGNPGPGGWGCICLIDNFKILSYISGTAAHTTNNRMELIAILQALEWGDTIFSNYNLIIHTDSSYCYNIWTQWIEGWFKNGWKKANKQPIENPDLIQSLYNYYTKDFQNCRLEKAKGHAGILGNELADALATQNQAKFDKICNENNIETVKDIDNLKIL